MRRGVDETELLDTDDELDAVAEDTEVEVTRVQIEQTRADMGETIDAIKERLSPSNLVQQAKDTVREATVGRAQEAMGSAVETVRETVGGAVGTAREAVGDVVDTARGAGSTVWETIRQNPIPTALMGIGMGWLWMSAQRQQSQQRFQRRYYSEYEEPPAYEAQPGFTDRSYPSGSWAQYEEPSDGGSAVGQTLRGAQAKVGELAGQARETVAEVADQAQEKAAQVAAQVRDQASQLRAEARYRAERTADWFEETMEQNPLAVGAAAVALGLVVGFALPETPKEHQLMGEARDRLAERAQQTVQEVAHKVQNVAAEAVDTAKEEAKKQGLTLEAETLPAEPQSTPGEGSPPF